VVAVSQNLLVAIRKLGCENAIYIPNCVETQESEAHTENRNALDILFVGSLTKGKRLDLLVQAFRKVADRVPNAKLTIAGSGPMRGFVEKLVSSFNLADRICLTGYLHEKELADLYRRSNIFVLSSDQEGLPLSLLEAMSFGKGIIISESANSGVIQNGIQGLLFRQGDAEDLSRKMLWFFENPDELLKMSQNAKNRCEHEYSVRAVAPRLEQLYAEVSAMNK
jgi:glycosyltransferase involved in cell wall biosynthesis